MREGGLSKSKRARERERDKRGRLARRRAITTNLSLPDYVWVLKQLAMVVLDPDRQKRWRRALDR